MPPFSKAGLLVDRLVWWLLWLGGNRATCAGKDVVAEDRAIGIRSYLGLLPEIKLLILNKRRIGKGFMCSLKKSSCFTSAHELSC